MEPLDKSSLADQAAEAIKRQIVTHHLQTGARLPAERQLCETLGISRNILREALSILVAQGIVTKVAGRGAYVGDFDRRGLDVHIRLTIEDESDLGALHDLRMMLELGAIEFAVQRADGRELDHVEEVLVELERKLAAGKRVNELDAQFHLALFAAAHSPALLRLYEQVLRDVTDARVYQNPTFRDLLATEAAVANIHLLRQALDALRRRDAQAAWQAMKAHISW
jgi:DNA-binding FadR family transcriptional regulator